jgi:hypothetical protein
LDRSWLISDEESLTPKEHRRAPDQTFLTYPEWFLVFGPAEYAEFLQHHTSSNFPLMTHVFQAWESYRAVDDQIRGVYPPNDEYHTMIKVINTSSTIEFGLKDVYETVVGRMTDVGSGEIATDEDRFNARYAREYVAFLDTAPWYEFDFMEQMRRLWRNSSLLGAHPVRKLERRWFLTSELAVKAVYGRMIKQATRSAYEVPSPVTAVVLDRHPEDSPATKEVKILNALPDGSILATLPRYAPFTPIALEFARQGVRFQEIAGNRTAVLISVIGPSDWQFPSQQCKLLFRQPIPTKQGQSRWVLATRVPSLHQALRELVEAGATVEHVFDF